MAGERRSSKPPGGEVSMQDLREAQKCVNVKDTWVMSFLKANALYPLRNEIVAAMLAKAMLEDPLSSSDEVTNAQLSDNQTEKIVRVANALHGVREANFTIDSERINNLWSDFQKSSIKKVNSFLDSVGAVLLGSSFTYEDVQTDSHVEIRKCILEIFDDFADIAYSDLEVSSIMDQYRSIIVTRREYSKQLYQEALHLIFKKLQQQYAQDDNKKTHASLLNSFFEEFIIKKI
jgi:hypothetical protein